MDDQAEVMTTQEKRSSLPSMKKIVLTQSGDVLIQEIFDSKGISIDQADRVCWGCGVDTCNLARAHIKPLSLSGGNLPDNFFLLCDVCHQDQPDAQSKLQQLIWLYNRDNYMLRIMSTYKTSFDRIHDVPLGLAAELLESECVVNSITSVKSGSFNLNTLRSNADTHAASSIRKWVNRKLACKKQKL